MTSDRPTLAELLDTWQQWSYRNLLTGAIAKADSSDQTEQAETLRAGLARAPQVTPLAALAANHELSRLLRGWQWHAIRDARHGGATWAQIADALETTPERARAGFLEQIERAERHGGRLTDTTPYRAVLDDPPPASSLPAQPPNADTDLARRAVGGQPATVMAKSAAVRRGRAR